MRAASKRPPSTGLPDIFFALGDATRLSLVRRLVDRAPLSATQLGAGLDVTRQGVAKHLQVLTDARLVTARKQGRERLYMLDARSVKEAREFLDGISAGWDRALARLKDLVENTP